MDGTVAPESDYWHDRIARAGRHTGVGHIRISERTNRRRKRALFPLMDSLFAKWLDEGLEGKEVLDAGCGTGIYSDFYLAHGANVAGVDAAASAIEMARQYVPDATFHHGSLTELPLADASVDVVHCFSVLFHIMDDTDWAAAVKELHRVLRPGGILLLRVEVVPRDQPVAGHQRLRGWPSYAEAFSVHGSRVQEMVRVVDMPRFVLGRRRFGPFVENPIDRLVLLRKC